MNPIRLLHTAIIILAAAPCLACLSTEARAQQEPADKEFDTQGILKAQPLKHAAGDNELQKLLKDRYNAALMATQARLRFLEAGQCPIEEVLEDAKLMLRSELELSDAPADRVKVREKQLKIAQ